MWPEIQLIPSARKKFNYTRTKLEKVRREIREKLYEIMRNFQVYEPKINKKLNLLRLMDQIVEVNIRFLSSYVDIYDLEELALFTTLSRGIFELHLILLEATRSEEEFVKIQFKVSDSYRLFIEKFLGLAIKSNNADAVEIFRRELKRIGKRRQEFSKRWEIDLRTLKAYSKYFDFEEIAEKYGLSADYKFDYGLLSSFLHPTDLYILTCPALPGTMEPRKLELARWNVRNRGKMIKNECTRVALDYSNKTKNKIVEVMKQFG